MTDDEDEEEYLFANGTTRKSNKTKVYTEAGLPEEQTLINAGRWSSTNIYLVSQKNMPCTFVHIFAK